MDAARGRDHGGFRLTTAKWLTPDKVWINGTGIVPDVVVDPTALGGDDPAIDAALEVPRAGDGQPRRPQRACPRLLRNRRLTGIATAGHGR